MDDGNKKAMSATLTLFIARVDGPSFETIVHPQAEADDLVQLERFVSTQPLVYVLQWLHACIKYCGKANSAGPFASLDKKHIANVLDGLAFSEYMHDCCSASYTLCS